MATTTNRSDLNSQASAAAAHLGGPAIRWISTIGVATLVFAEVEATAAALCWSLQGILGLPDTIALGMFSILFLAGVWATLWFAMRNWHVEKRLERGLEIDDPQWSVMAYMKRRSDPA
ncbi:hypothetical protein FHS85_002975 [Rhodoligotrophos appendicifer]|uniref:hypothetical protein n=1 Tax=Rhodoligotrophos appendicifer TaxID=987056 RepID=UPI0011859EDF|nr:hypothetical protein [Rhodoligotrophos appendicifer]